MTVATIFDACRPRDDVMEGRVVEADFAADLAQVIVGGGSGEYRDPARFFANTYPTRGLRSLLSNTCRRLTGAGGEAAAMFRLDTSYGGGKTHGLIALTHAARGMEGVSNVSEFIDPGLVPRGRVRVAAFDGENADPANGRAMGDGVLAYTPWGEIAYALAGKAGYERVRNSDTSRSAPGASTLRELFGGEPTLILLDELSVYLRKVRNLEGEWGQLTAFLTTLFKAVESAPNAALVYTLAVGKDGSASDAYSEENKFIADNMEEAASVSARQATLLNPTEEDETVQVLRRRLFDSIDGAAAAPVVEAYRDLWTANSGSLAADAARSETVETFRESYPLHTRSAGDLDRQDGDARQFSARARHVAASGSHCRAAVGRAARRCDGDPSSPYRPRPGVRPAGDRHPPRPVRLSAGDLERHRRRRRQARPGPGDRRRTSQRSASLRGLCGAHRLHAHPRLQRAAQGSFAGGIALLDPLPGDGHQLRRGSAQEIHRRIRLSRRPSRRADTLSRRGQFATDHPARGAACGCGRGPRRTGRSHPRHIRRRHVRRYALPRRTVRRSRRGRRRPAETGRPGL